MALHVVFKHIVLILCATVHYYDMFCNICYIVEEKHTFKKSTLVSTNAKYFESVSTEKHLW